MVDTTTTDTQSTTFKVGLVADFIQKQLGAVRMDNGEISRPLIVSMQGPQGAGKSTLAEELVSVLWSQYALRCVVASLDDFYFPNSGLRSLAESNPGNALLQGRGPPGTHDLPLLKSTLERLHSGDPPSVENPVRLPIFDKSMFNGEGDRSPITKPIDHHIDVFLLEGWSLGYQPVSEEIARERWHSGTIAKQHPFSSLQQINSNLAKMEASLGRFDCHIAIRPVSYEYVYTWRLEQERNMKVANGGKGMSDEAVRSFVDRYMPVYEVFGRNLPSRPTLCLRFGEHREVLLN